MTHGSDPVGLRFGAHLVDVTVERDAARELDPVWDFVKPHFDVLYEREAAGVVQLRFAPIHELPLEASADETVVRRTSDPTKQIVARRWMVGTSTALYVESSATGFLLDPAGAGAQIFVSGRSRYHVSDFLRGVVWEIAGGSGSFVHAAAVVDRTGEGVIAFAGRKGAGKTTTALEFVVAGASYFSGDSLYLPNDGAGRCYSWPDYPYIGWGTLRMVEGAERMLAARGLVPGPDREKVLLPHDWLQTALGATQSQPPRMLRTVVLPRLHDDLPSTRPALCPTEPDPDALQGVIRQWSAPTEGWEPFLGAIRARCAPSPQPASSPAVTWFERRGQGRLDAAEIEAVLAS